MSILKQHERKRVIDKLIGIMDGRRGSLLFVGAELPEIAVHAMGRGLYVTVVESDVQRMEAFLEPLKAAGFDQSVSWDRRPYESIEFLSSSYNYVIRWDGIPPAFSDPALFFKKVRRELKAGGTLFLRTKVRHGPADAFPALKSSFDKLPAGLKEKLTQATATLEATFAKGDIPLVATVQKWADRFLDFEAVDPLSVMGSQLTRLPRDVRGPFQALPPQLFALFTKVDDILSASKSGKLLPATALFTFAKTKEFGRVFIMK
jgi:hypothetical protein